MSEISTMLKINSISVVFKKRNGSTNLFFGNTEVKQKKQLQKLDAIALGSGNGMEGRGPLSAR